MKTGRPTADPKGERINLRVNTQTAEWLKQQSEVLGIGVSEVIRRILREHSERS